MIPPGALTGVQFIKTPDYVEIVGYIDQTAIGLQANDSGGEEVSPIFRPPHFHQRHAQRYNHRTHTEPMSVEIRSAP